MTTRTTRGRCSTPPLLSDTASCSDGTLDLVHSCGWPNQGEPRREWVGGFVDGLQLAHVTRAKNRLRVLATY
jgi:hypothetical protein